MPEEIAEGAIFHAPGEIDARQALEAVREGRAVIVEHDRKTALQRSVTSLVARAIAEGRVTLDRSDEN
jgi:hypothetical protein